MFLDLRASSIDIKHFSRKNINNSISRKKTTMLKNNQKNASGDISCNKTRMQYCKMPHK